MNIQYWWFHRSQRSGTRSITHCNEHVKVKLCGQRDILWDTLWHTTASMMRCFLCLRVCVCVCVCVCYLACRLEGQRADMKNKMIGTWVPDVKLTERINSLKTKPKILTLFQSCAGNQQLLWGLRATTTSYAEDSVPCHCCFLLFVPLAFTFLLPLLGKKWHRCPS